jgi:hypothetical protein
LPSSDAAICSNRDTLEDALNVDRETLNGLPDPVATDPSVEASAA